MQQFLKDLAEFSKLIRWGQKTAENPSVTWRYGFAVFVGRRAPGSARLMLALLEYIVADLGGTYAMEDTDSMAIVSTELGGLIPCPEPLDTDDDWQPAILALSWERVDGIVKRFESLNPYERDAVPGSILKIEDDNWKDGDPKTGEQRQLSCVAISAKRYALFVKDNAGEPVLLRNGINNSEDRWSEHGLGHLLNPTDPNSEDREWVAQVWLGIVRRALGLPTEKMCFEDVPAVGRLTISSPAVMRPLVRLNSARKYPDQLKPFNFLVTCHVKPFGHPEGADVEHFHLIAPYELDPRKWLQTEWIDQYTGNRCRISTDSKAGGARVARVKTYGDVIEEYKFHAESKCADAEGQPSGKQTIGHLQRRHVYIQYVRFVGKESNSLEDVHAGVIHSEDEAYTEYPDPARDEWQVKILPAIRGLPLLLLVKESGLTERALQKIRAGRRPHPKNQKRLAEIVRNA
jgi:hypothetical protein